MARIVGFLRRKPLQRRVTALTLLLVTSAIVVSNVAGYVALRVTLYEISQSFAIAVATDLVGPATRSIQQSGQLDEEVRQAAGVVVEAVHPDGTVIHTPGPSAELVLKPGDLRATRAGADPVTRTAVDTRGASYIIAAVPLGSTGYALVVARPLGDVLEILRVERLIVLLVILGSVVGAGVAGGFIAHYALRPVRQLTAAVRHVTETKDFQPLGMRFAFGDLTVLASSFNQLLRAITSMRERQSRLVADAGHELRTPLTSLSTNVDLLISDLHHDQLTAVQKAQLMGDVRGQLSELTDLVGDLVHLARDDSAGAFRPLDLRDVVQAALTRVRRRASDRLFDVVLDEFHVVGDADGLERVVTNLLDNAVKWSPPASTIRVRLQGNRLSVADSGPGIPEEDLPYVFDRFFRGESARKTQGTGLGLSIVAKTVEDHGGLVCAGRSADGGAELTVQLPASPTWRRCPACLSPSAERAG